MLAPSGTNIDSPMLQKAEREHERHLSLIAQLKDQNASLARENLQLTQGKHRETDEMSHYSKCSTGRRRMVKLTGFVLPSSVQWRSWRTRRRIWTPRRSRLIV
jgi:hypothetical protein